MIEKDALRRELRRRLRELSPSARARGNADALAQLRWVIDEPAPVMLYAPMADELDVWPLVEARVRAGRSVGLPRIEAAGLSVRLLTFGLLHAGPLGILEPDPESPPIEVGWVIVPGLGFDASGGRIGRGKGYYDRYLAHIPEARTVGVGFDVQRVAKCPMAPHDVALQTVIFGQTAEAG